MDPKYREMRANVERIFAGATPSGDAQTIVSPNGEFRLDISEYATGPKTWAYSRGIVSRSSDGLIIADIKRNLSHFWHCWIHHPNGKQYLLCGEDYQGYSVVNLTDEIVHVYFPPEGHKGHGFCWTDAYPSPDGLALAVEGCYWAYPYDIVFFDFRNPDQLPFQELGRIGSLEVCEGWQDNATFVMTREVQYRVSDGKAYETLSEAEQAELDANGTLSAHRTERVRVPRPPVA